MQGIENDGNPFPYGEDDAVMNSNIKTARSGVEGFSRGEKEANGRSSILIESLD